MYQMLKALYLILAILGVAAACSGIATLASGTFWCGCALIVAAGLCFGGAFLVAITTN